MLDNLRDVIKNLMPKKENEQLQEITHEKGEDIKPKAAAPKSYGLKNKRIFLILGIVGTVFFTFIVYGMIKNTTTTNPADIERDYVTNIKGPADNHPSNYEDLAKMVTGEEKKPKPELPLAQTPAPVPVPAPRIEPTQQVDTGRQRIEQEKTEAYKSNIAVRFGNQPGSSNSNSNNQAATDNTSLNGVNQQLNNNNHILKVNYKASAQYQINEGTIIPAVLLTGINSDLKGQVVAQVRQHVFDSLTGNYLLIPQGTRLLGVYGGDELGAGSTRIAVTWVRMILPNGNSVNLGEMASLDKNGYPGLKDKVNRHTARLYQGAFMTSLFAAASMMAAGGNNSDDRSPGQEAIAGAATNILNIGSKIAEKNLDVQPTITIRPGTVFDVYVGKDIVGLKPFSG